MQNEPQLLSDLRRFAVQTGPRLLVIRPQHLARLCIDQEHGSPVAGRPEAGPDVGRRARLLLGIVARPNLRHLLLEGLSDPVRENRVGQLRVGHYLDHAIARQLLREILVESARHRQNVNGMHCGCLGERAERGNRQKQKSFHLQSQFTVNPGQTIAAVVPVHNRSDLLSRLLDTIRAQSVGFAEVIVVDNASTDNAREIARNFGCTVIEMPENAGFARAVNVGWQTANADWIAILNSDVELDPLWAERLLGASQAVSFAAGMILNAANRSVIDGTYDLVSRSGCAWRAGNGERAPDKSGRAVPIHIAPATACMFRRTALQRLGGFDERFGSYLEDVDLGLRCVREGIHGVFVPAALAWHHGSATLGRWNPAVVRLISRNQLLLVSRHYDRRLFWSCLWPILAGQLLWGVVALRHGTLLAWASGKWEALKAFRIDAAPSTALCDFLSASEHEIGRRSHDPYWRWYFRLTALPGRLPRGAAH